MDDLRAVPTLSPLEAEQFWTDGEDARSLKPGATPETESTCCAGTDLPGVGNVHSAGCPLEGLPRRSGQERRLGGIPETSKDLVGGGDREAPKTLPEPLAAFVEAMGPEDLVVRLSADDVLEMRAFDCADHERNRLLSQLLFVARDLAESRIMRVGDRGEGKLITPSWCMECQQNEADGSIAHAPGCKTGRVLAVLLELVVAGKAPVLFCGIDLASGSDWISAPLVNPDGKEAAPDGERPEAGDGIRPRGLSISEEKGRRFEIGGGPGDSWILKLFEDGEDAGGGQYPADEYDAALEFGQEWSNVWPAEGGAQ